MSKARDLDIFARSLSGDWESRIELFRKFLWDSPEIRRLGNAYQNTDDFLHDAFTNVLRTGHSYNPESDLGEWMEIVAEWTALERQRPRHTYVSDATARVRLCAQVEGDEGGRLASYAPPFSGAEDSLASRIAALVGEPQFKLLCKRSIEKSTWKDIATAAGKPQKAIGPMLVRTVEALSRFFGAPPPLNADLEPVFAWIVREDAVPRHGNPDKPKGRILSMQLDPAFYSVTPEMRAIGLAVPAEVRTITLWDAARTSAPPGEALRDHLAKCNYCADLLRALLLMQQTLEGKPDAAYRLCPGACTLVNPPKEDYEAYDRHLDECPACREDRASIVGVEEGEEGEESKTETSRSAGLSAAGKAGWAAIALLVLGIGYFAPRWYFKAMEARYASANIETSAPAIAVNSRYRDLAQHIDDDDVKWLGTVSPNNRATFYWLLNEIKQGNTGGAALVASGVADKDPGLQMLYAQILYTQQGVSVGYQAMTKAEAIPPRNSFRCWAMLQSAIIVGDLKTAAREVEHLASDPEYGPRAKALMARVKARG